MFFIGVVIMILVLLLFFSVNLFAFNLSDYKFAKEYNRGNYARAQAIAEELLLGDPFDQDKLYNLANTLYKQEKFKEAAIYFNKLTEQELDDSKKEQVFFNLGNSYAQLKEYESALKAYEQVLNLNPDNARAKNNYEIIKKLLEQQKNQQNQNQDDKNQEQNNQDKSGNDDNNQDKKDQDREQESNQDKQSNNESEEQDSNKQNSNNQNKSDQKSKDEASDAKEDKESLDDGKNKDKREQPRKQDRKNNTKNNSEQERSSKSQERDKQQGDKKDKQDINNQNNPLSKNSLKSDKENSRELQENNRSDSQSQVCKADEGEKSPLNAQQVKLMEYLDKVDSDINRELIKVYTANESESDEYNW
jgi:Ca-activated chloride channel homolog